MQFLGIYDLWNFMFKIPCYISAFKYERQGTLVKKGIDYWSERSCCHPGLGREMDTQPIPEWQS